MGYICTNISALYAGILRYEKNYKCKNLQLFERIKELISTSISMTKYEVNKLVLYKAEEDPSWQWTQKELYSDGHDYGRELQEEAERMISQNVKLDIPYGAYEQPPVLRNRGHHLVNRFADMYCLCVDLMHTMSKEEFVFFDVNVVRFVLHIYSQAESIDKKIEDYEKKGHSQEVLDNLVANDDHDFETRESELKEDE